MFPIPDLLSPSWQHTPRRAVRPALVGTLSAVGLLVLTTCIATLPAPARIGTPPAALRAEDVHFPSRSGSVIHAWFLPGQRGAGAVLLLHGVRANRLAMLGRAHFLHDSGYTVLMPDFQAHGESPGSFITFGALESRDAKAALQFLRARAPGERVGAIGVSMGGAAALVGSEPLAVDALVLESVYPTIRQAAANRLRTWLGPLGSIATLLTPVIIQGIHDQTGVSERDLMPVERITHVRTPVLVAAGSADKYTPLAETRALFDSARGPKALWIVGGAGHEDLYAFTPRPYRDCITAFLRRYLRASTRSAATAVTPAPCGGPLPKSVRTNGRRRSISVPNSVAGSGRPAGGPAERMMPY